MASPVENLGAKPLGLTDGRFERMTVENSKTRQRDIEAPMNAKRPSLFVAALSNWLPYGTSVLTALLVTPFVLAHLGTRGYGVWSLTLSFVGYYGLMQLSVGSGIMRYVPFYAGREDNAAASQIVSTGLGMFTVVGLIILLVSALIAEPLSRFYDGGRELATLIRLTGLGAAIECPTKNIRRDPPVQGKVGYGEFRLRGQWAPVCDGYSDKPPRGRRPHWNGGCTCCLRICCGRRWLSRTAKELSGDSSRDRHGKVVAVARACGLRCAFHHRSRGLQHGSVESQAHHWQAGLA